MIMGNKSATDLETVFDDAMVEQEGYTEWCDMLDADCYDVFGCSLSIFKDAPTEQWFKNGLGVDECIEKIQQAIARTKRKRALTKKRYNDDDESTRQSSDDRCDTRS